MKNYWAGVRDSWGIIRLRAVAFGYDVLVESREIMSGHGWRK